MLLVAGTVNLQRYPQLRFIIAEKLGQTISAGKSDNDAIRV